MLGFDELEEFIGTIAAFNADGPDSFTGRS